MTDHALCRERTCPKCGSKYYTYGTFTWDSRRASESDPFSQSPRCRILELEVENKRLTARITELERAPNKFFDWMFYAIFNANDFFAWACADCVEFDDDELKQVWQQYRKYGDAGIQACMSAKRGLLPQQPVLEKLPAEFECARQEALAMSWDNEEISHSQATVIKQQARITELEQINRQNEWALKQYRGD